MWRRQYNRRKLFSPKKRMFIFNRQRDFAPRHTINEYFYKRSSLNWQKKVLIYFFAVVFIYIIYFFLFSNYFKIEHIIIEGNTRISTSDIQKIAENSINKKKLLIFRNNNYFLFNPNSIKKELTKNNVLENLVVKKRYCSTLFIYVKEKDVKAVYKLGDKYALLDKIGNVISIVSDFDNEVKKQDKILLIEIPKKIIENQNAIDEQNKNIVKDNPLYQSTSSTVFISELINGKQEVKEVAKISPQEKDLFMAPLELGKNIIKKENIEKISYINDNFKNKLNIKPIEYQYEFERQDMLIVNFDKNFKTFFRLDENLETQINNLYKYVIEEKHELNNIEYIDLRQKDQIIIK